MQQAVCKHSRISILYSTLKRVRASSKGSHSRRLSPFPQTYIDRCIVEHRTATVLNYSVLGGYVLRRPLTSCYLYIGYLHTSIRAIRPPVHSPFRAVHSLHLVWLRTIPTFRTYDTGFLLVWPYRMVVWPAPRSTYAAVCMYYIRRLTEILEHTQGHQYILCRERHMKDTGRHRKTQYTE